jgi:hypothetical protein
MCIILPVDHIPCTHTVAIWQHCTKAVRYAQGMKPCSRIRQHARPILTRKLCVHCGGPRYFSRRGGIAERGSGSPVKSTASEEKDDGNESYDSGYHSDVIHEEDEGEQEDITMSPTASMVPAKRSREAPRQRSSSRTRSPSGRRPSWRPNLKQELSAEHIEYRNQSIDLTLAKYEEGSTIAALEESPVIERSTTPILSRPQPRRKSSTLLHPSPPLESTGESQESHAITSAELTPPSTPPQRPVPVRQGSSLLHPSTPAIETTISLSNARAFPFNFSMPTPRSSPLPPTSAPRPSPHPSASAPVEVPLRPSLTHRKNSTLLHPSPPPESHPTAAAPFILPIHAKTILSLPPTPLATPVTDSFQLRRSPSGRSPLLFPASQSDDEWEEPLHSSHSDGEDDSDDCPTEAYTEVLQEKAVLARTGRMGRASRISLLSDGTGNALRILQDL